MGLGSSVSGLAVGGLAWFILRDQAVAQWAGVIAGGSVLVLALLLQGFESNTYQSLADVRDKIAKPGGHRRHTSSTDPTRASSRDKIDCSTP
jgi:hypothetical protein